MKKIILIALLLLATCSFNFTVAQGTWTPKANFGGAARYWASGFAIGNKIYMGLGYDGNSIFFNDFWEYDIPTNTWTQKAPYPGGGRLYVTGFSVGNKGYFACGYNGTMRNDFWEYDPASNTWTQKTNFPGTGRWGAVGFSIGNKGYVGTGDDIGGNGSGSRNDFYEWDQNTNTWTQKSNFPGTPVYSAVGFSIGTKGYIGTGFDGTNSHNEFYEWNQATDTWTQKASVGGANRYQAWGFSVGTKGYIGCGSPGVNDVWMWDQVNNTWTAQTSFPGVAVNVSTAVSVGGKGYVGLGQPATKQLWELSDICGPVPANISAGGPTTLCPGDSVVLTSDSATAYVWSNAANTQSTVVYTSGNYFVTVTDSAGCNGISAPISVNVYTLAPIDATASDSSICIGESVTLNGSGPSNYAWAWNNGVSDGIPFQPNSTLMYHLTATDLNGCTKEDSILVTVNSLPITTLDLSAIDTACQNHGLIALSGESPAGGIFSGTNVSGTSFNAASSAAGTYTVVYTYTDLNNCSSSDSATIYVDLCTGISHESDNTSTAIFPNPFSHQTTITFDGVLKSGTLVLTDALGKTVRSQQINGEVITFEKGELVSGVYYLTIIRQRQVMARKKLVIE